VPTLPVLAHAHAPRATVAPRWRALTGGAAGAATHWAGPTNGLGRRARGLVGPLLQPRHAVERPATTTRTVAGSVGACRDDMFWPKDHRISRP